MITSIQNPLVKKINGLQNKQKNRKKEKLFVVDGIKMILETPKDRIEDLIVTDRFFHEHEKLHSFKQVTIVSETIMKHLSTSVTPQGVLATVQQSKIELTDLKLNHQSLILALECIQDPGNLGTMIRTAEACGATAVLLSKGTVDVYNPKVIRATMGSIFRIPILSNLDFTSTIPFLKEHAIKIYAAHLEATKYYFQCNFTSGSCFLIGNEGNGLTEKTSTLSDQWIKIPIVGEAESLNASMASGILLYEAVKQRLCT